MYCLSGQAQHFSVALAGSDPRIRPWCISSASLMLIQLQSRSFLTFLLNFSVPVNHPSCTQAHLAARNFEVLPLYWWNDALQKYKVSSQEPYSWCLLFLWVKFYVLQTLTTVLLSWLVTNLRARRLVARQNE